MNENTARNTPTDNVRNEVFDPEDGGVDRVVSMKVVS